MPSPLYRLIRAMLLGLLCLPLPARAEGNCAFNDWLVQTYHAARAYEQAVANGRRSIPSDTLQRDVARFSSAELKSKLRSAGLSQHSATVSQFFTAQRSLMISQTQFGNHNARKMAQRPGFRQQAQKMKAFIGNMHCDSDPSWRPAGGGSFTKGATEVGGLSPGQRLSLPHAIAADTFSLILVAAAICATGLVIVVFRTRALWRRRAHRHGCALPCRLSGQGIRSMGEVLDISQMGAKIRADHALPPDTKHCLVHLAGTILPGRIVWRNAPFVGVAFKPRLDRTTLAALLRQPPPSASPQQKTAPVAGRRFEPS